MKTYFVSSDIHGFYSLWKEALNENGFDINNPDHILIILGDIFDRGKEPLELYKFLKDFPEDRLILIKGNHEYLLMELVQRGIPYSHDYHNGTYQTLISLSSIEPDKKQIEWLKEHRDEYKDVHELYLESNKILEEESKKLYNNEIINEIIAWIKSPRWRNYYELGQYIFVHSFIPLEIDIDDKSTDEYLFKYFPAWRTKSTKDMWYDATWPCPYEFYLKGYFAEEEKKGKILVCGHWHTSDFFNKLLYKNKREKWLDIYESNPIFISKKYPGLIGIDSCIAACHKVNILIIKEEELIYK